MQPIWSNLAVLTVTAIFYLWRAHQQVSHRRNRRLRERVAYMLWVAAGSPGVAAAQLAEVD
jgi:hypothetical protein